MTEPLCRVCGAPRGPLRRRYNTCPRLECNSVFRAWRASKTASRQAARHKRENELLERFRYRGPTIIDLAHAVVQYRDRLAVAIKALKKNLRKEQYVTQDAIQEVSAETSE